MLITKHPNQYSLTGNPVVFEMESDSSDPVLLTVTIAGQTIELLAHPYAYQLGFKVSYDIADILSSFFDSDSKPYGETIVIAELENFVLDYQVKIEEQTFDLKAIDGGLSIRAFEELVESNLDMFSYRLNNSDRSILLTTRTNSPYIYLKESEVFPFVFLHPGPSISFISTQGNIITMPSMQKGIACLFDLNSLRKMFYDLYHEVTTYFELQIEGSSSCYITLTPSVFREDKYLIRFKNSLGGYEQLELIGSGTRESEFSEENTYQQYNNNFLFKTKRERLEVKETISLQTGYKTKDELNFLLDLIASDRSYFIFPDGKIYECLVTVEDFKIPLRITTPTSVELKITLTSQSKYHSPSIDLVRPGAWILETGFWNDFAAWIDKKQWID